jgi:hypothetical protein
MANRHKVPALRRHQLHEIEIRSPDTLCPYAEKFQKPPVDIGRSPSDEEINGVFGEFGQDGEQDTINGILSPLLVHDLPPTSKGNGAHEWRCDSFTKPYILL